jgi:peptidoglycan hydrolase-like protein with peptidoglycan-binding domain
MLSIGSVGQAVTLLQTQLNQIGRSRLPALAVDGQFGARTQARVMEFQSANGLVADGLVGERTIRAILELLNGLLTTSGPVRLVTEQILGSFPSHDNLIDQVIPSVQVVDVADFQAGRGKRPLQFRRAPQTTARIAIFSCEKGGDKRAVILALPPTGRPSGVIFTLHARFGQAVGLTPELKNFADPLDPTGLKFILLKHVVQRYAPQVIASGKPLAVAYIMRSAGKSELGPFANDGDFVRDCLAGMASLTNGAFGFDTVEASTHSNGIVDFGPFVGSMAGKLNVKAIYNIDPVAAMGAPVVPGAARRQYLSGQTGAARPGFVFLPHEMWRNEDFFNPRPTGNQMFNYLHSSALPRHCLFMGLNGV